MISKNRGGRGKQGGKKLGKTEATPWLGHLHSPPGPLRSKAMEGGRKGLQKEEATSVWAKRVQEWVEAGRMERPRREQASQRQPLP